jgi:hypothetical protein
MTIFGEKLIRGFSKKHFPGFYIKVFCLAFSAKNSKSLHLWAKTENTEFSRQAKIFMKMRIVRNFTEINLFRVFGRNF